MSRSHSPLARRARHLPFLLAAVSLPAAAALAQDVTVPTDFATITAAAASGVDADQDGTLEIAVLAGTYQEDVRIARSDVRVVGAGAATTTIQGSGLAHVVRVEAFTNTFLSNVGLEGLTLAGGGALFDGVEFRRVNGGGAVDCVATGNADGFRLNATAGLVLSGNLAHDNAGSGFKMTGSTGYAVTMNESRDNLDHGFDLGSVGMGSLAGNTATGNGSNGLRVRRSIDVTAAGNAFTGNVDNGIRLERSMRLTLSGNTVTGNQSNGLRMRATLDTVVTQNAFDGNANFGIRRENWNNDDFDAGLPGAQNPMGDNSAVGNGSGALRED